MKKMFISYNTKIIMKKIIFDLRQWSTNRKYYPKTYRFKCKQQVILTMQSLGIVNQFVWTFSPLYQYPLE